MFTVTGTLSGTSILSTIVCVMLALFSDVGSNLTLTIAAINAIAALITGYAAVKALNRSKDDEEDYDSKVDHMARHSRRHSRSANKRRTGEPKSEV